MVRILTFLRIILLRIRKRAQDRVFDAIKGDITKPDYFANYKKGILTGVREKEALVELLSYPLSRALLSCLKDRYLIQRFSLIEAKAILGVLRFESQEVLETMARHSQQGLGYEVALRSQKPKDASILSQYVVEGLPSIGPKAAHQLLKHFKTVSGVFSASQEELCEVSGIGKKTASRIHEILNFHYDR